VASELENSYSAKKGLKSHATFQDGRSLLVRYWKPAAAILVLLLVIAGGVAANYSSRDTAGTMPGAQVTERGGLSSSKAPDLVNALPQGAGEGTCRPTPGLPA
jgi:hypothetical protein